MQLMARDIPILPAPSGIIPPQAAGMCAGKRP